MAYQFSLVQTSPYVGETDVEVNGPFILQFNRAPDSSTLSTGITLLEKATNTSVDVAMTVSGYSVTIAPTSALTPGTEYVLSVTAAVTDLMGIELSNPLAIEFTTALDALTAPQLLSPDDGAVLDSWPTFEYSPVTGATSYNVEVSLYPTMTPTTTSHDPGHTYYWRVQAVDSSGNTGPWSEIRSFYFRAEDFEVPEYTAEDQRGDMLSITSVSPAAGATNIATLSSIVILFNDILADGTGSECYVQVLPFSGNIAEFVSRVGTGYELDTVTGIYKMTGTWDALNSQLTFTPDNTTLLENCEYRVVLKGITSENGYTLSDDYYYSFYSTITPLYLSVETLRALLPSILGDSDISDALLLRHIYLASLWCDNAVPDFADYIEDSSSEYYNEAYQLVLARAKYNILYHMYIERVTIANTRQTVGDFTYQVNDLNEYRRLLEELEDEMTELVEILLPNSTVTARIGSQAIYTSYDNLMDALQFTRQDFDGI